MPTVLCVLVVTKTESLSTQIHIVDWRGKASSGNNGLFDNLPHIFCELNFERIITQSLPIVGLREEGYICCFPGYCSVVIFSMSNVPLIYHLSSVQSYSIKLLKYFNEN